ncbi:Flp pilus assembly protein TadD [Nitrobacteraceae bacterium AZCC 2146]
MSDLLPSLAREAQEAYEAGNFDAAISKQKQLMAETTRFIRPRVHDYLALAMFLFESSALGESFDRLQKAAAIWPANTEVAENAGVLLLRLDWCEEAEVEFERARQSSSRRDRNVVRSCGHSSV